MKVFEFHVGTFLYGYQAQTIDEATQQFKEDTGTDEEFTVEELSDLEIDEKNIEMYEDNDTTKESYYESIRDLILGDEPRLIYTNDEHALNL